MAVIEVVLRMCAKPALSGDASRPPGFSKEEVFLNLLTTRDANTNITVLFDGDSTGHWVENYDVKIVKFVGGTGDSSFMFQLNYIRSQNFDKDTIVYILEDDYVHKDGWSDILREGFGTIQPNNLAFHYVTLYDHRDKYTSDWYTNLTSRVGVSESIHWRTVPSTTNTFAVRYSTLVEDWDVHYHFLNRDHHKFLELGARGRVLGSCMPGYSTHCHKDYISPFFYRPPRMGE
jgi:hypothetical protein